MNKKIISYLVTVILCISCILSTGAVTVSAASGSTVTTLATGDYYIYSGVGSDKVLDVYGSSKTNGANVIINKFSKSASQVFHVTNMGGGTYTIQNKNSGNMLDVYAASTASGTNVWQYAANSSKAQKWSILTSTKSGYYTVKSALSANVLDVYGATNTAGSNVWVYSPNNTSAQQWKFVKVSTTTSTSTSMTTTTNKKATFTSGYYMIQSKLSSSRYLEVANDSFDNGGNVQLGPTGQLASRVFYLTNLGSGNYTIENALSGKKMDLKNGKTDNNTNIQQYTNSNSTSQKWYISSTRTDGYYTISSSINHKKVVDVAGANSAVGTNVGIYTLNKTDAQYWKFVRVSKPTCKINNGTYILRSCLSNAYVASVPSKSSKQSENVALYRNQGNNYQKWKIASLGNGYYKITNVGSSKVLHVQGGARVNGTNVKQYSWCSSKAQKWKISGVHGIYTFTNMASGLTLDVASGTAANNANLQVYQSTGTRGQKFRLEATTAVQTVQTAQRTSNYVKDPATGKTFWVENQYMTDPVVGKDITEEDFLAAVLYTEAGDQGQSGMMMVGYVIQNRLAAGIAASKSGGYIEYPGTLDIMISEKMQWDVARNGSLTNVLKNIVAGTADYLASARAAAKKVLAGQNITLETTATQYTKASANVSSINTLKSGTVIKASDFKYNSFMTPNSWNRYANDGVHAKFASGYGAGKNTFIYKGHVFFLDSEVW